MKRILSVLLIAFLLLVPVLSAQADNGQYVYVDEGLLTADEIRTINDRAVEIAANRGVGIYYFFYGDVEDLSSFIMSFAKEHVVEENALVLGFNSDYRYFLQIGPIAEAALSDAVCEGPIMEAYRSVKGDPERKLLAYFNAADDALEAYFASGATVPAASGDSWSLADVPANIARTDSGKPTVIDRANLLTDSEAESLSKRLKEIGSAYKCDVVVATVPSLGLKTAEEYADDFFDYNGYGYGATPDANGTTVDGDGILLLLSTEARDFAVSTSGYGITAFTDYGIQEYLEPKFLPYLGYNDYAGGFNAYADGCTELLKMAREEFPYDCYHVYAENGTLDSAQLANANASMERFVDENGVALYYLCFPSNTDIDAFVERFLAQRVPESNAFVLGVGKDGVKLTSKGSLAASRFSGRRLTKVQREVEPLLESGNYYGAFEAFTNRCNKIMHPLNLFAVAIAIGIGLLFGFIPLAGMKRQLVSVQRRTDADEYLVPSTFTLTQNSDVLLGSNVSRSIHVQPTSSGGGGSRPSGGGGFHGGSSTHTSSSGGTHGGHSGKF